MRYVTVALAAIGLGFVALWLANTAQRRDQWTVLSGWET